MRRAYEADPEELQAHLDDFVVAVFADLTSSFLVMPKGPSFVEYPRFREAYEVLKRRTGGFRVSLQLPAHAKGARKTGPGTQPIRGFRGYLSRRNFGLVGFFPAA
jgi:hypothetical protein